LTQPGHAVKQAEESVATNMQQRGAPATGPRPPDRVSFWPGAVGEHPAILQVTVKARPLYKPVENEQGNPSGVGMEEFANWQAWIVDIEISRSGGGFANRIFEGTGSLVGRNDVLTTYSLIHDDEVGTWIWDPNNPANYDVTFYFGGKDSGLTAQADFVTFYFSPGLTDNDGLIPDPDVQNNIAVFRADQTIGDSVGFFNLALASGEVLLNAAGYPDLNVPNADGDTLVNNFPVTPVYDGVNNLILHNWISAFDGTTGAPIWAYYPDSDYHEIVAIQSHFNRAVYVDGLTNSRIQEIALNNGVSAGSDPNPPPTPPAPDVSGLAVNVYRFFNQESGGHFFTTSAQERDTVILNFGNFNYEGVGFEAVHADAEIGAELQPVYRFFNTQAGGHFFTADPAERDLVQATLPQFNFEGVAFQASTAPADGATPVHRFFNTKAGGHFFTVDENERAAVSKMDNFVYEGARFYAFLDDGSPVIPPPAQRPPENPEDPSPPMPSPPSPPPNFRPPDRSDVDLLPESGPLPAVPDGDGDVLRLAALGLADDILIA
jgi:hypothetical protein